MGAPAARIGDMHVCPMVAPGPCPHVGGPIAAGSPNVITGGMPQARVGDQAVCCCPPDSIAQGSSGVMVNNKPAARLGDSTAHGGKIVAGFPTVLIGGGGGGGGSTGSAAYVKAKTKAQPGTGASTTLATGAGDTPAMNPLAVSLSEAAQDGSAFTESPYCEVCNKK